MSIWVFNLVGKINRNTFHLDILPPTATAHTDPRELLWPRYAHNAVRHWHPAKHVSIGSMPRSAIAVAAKIMATMSADWMMLMVAKRFTRQASTLMFLFPLFCDLFYDRT